MADPCTKFEVSSFSRCGDITWGVKFYNGSPDPDHAFFREDFSSAGVELAMVNQCTKFDVSRLTCYEAMNDSAKCRKWGGLGWLGGTQGHRQCHHSTERLRLPIRL